MEKENPYLNVYLGPLKRPWVDYCNAIGKKPGSALKEAIELQLQKAAKQPEVKTYQQTSEAPPVEPKERFEILLTKSEKQAVRERANMERCSMRRWIVDAIRAGLTKEPQFGMREIDALGESNYQLLAIGRNLNQIAKRMNEGRQEDIALKSIDRLRDLIDRHTDVVSKAIRASLERWNIE